MELWRPICVLFLWPPLFRRQIGVTDQIDREGICKINIVLLGSMERKIVILVIFSHGAFFDVYVSIHNIAMMNKLEQMK